LEEKELVPSGFRDFLPSLELPGHPAEDLEEQGTTFLIISCSYASEKHCFA
jgi:hypothetical protein